MDSGQLSEALPGWSPAGVLCDGAGLPRGQGLLVFTQAKHNLNPGGTLLRYQSTAFGPVHLRPDMLFFRSAVHTKVGCRD